MSDINAQSTTVFQVKDDTLSHYGLSVNPFEVSFDHNDIANISVSAAEGGEEIPFFMGGDRRAVLDEVIHLCQFSNNLVAVLGEAGVGKTALVYQSVVELSDTSHCCLIRSSVMVSVDDMLRQLAQQLGVFIPEDLSAPESIVSLLSRYQPSGLHQRVVVVVDDAHHLSGDVLAALVGLLQQPSLCSFHVLLVGDSSLLPRLDQLDKGEVLAYDIPLCPFTVDELSDYLSFKLSVVGYQGAELFDYDVVESIWRDTRGIPASVNQVAANLLLNKALNKDEEERHLGLPMVYMGLLVLLLAALIMAIFYVGDSPDSSRSVVATSSENIESIDQGAESAPALPVASAPESLAPSVGDLVTPTKEAPNNDELSQAVTATVTSSPSVAADASLSPSLADAAGASTDSIASVSESPDSPAENEVGSSQPSVSLANDAVASTSSPSSPSLSNQTPSSEKIAALLTTDEQAVMFWPEEAYTLQVMAAGQLAGVEAFVAKQENRNLLRIVRLSRNGSPWYIVVVGIYDDIPSARQAIAGLPDPQKRAKPWPKKIGDLQGDIEDFRRR